MMEPASTSSPPSVENNSSSSASTVAAENMRVMRSEQPSNPKPPPAIPRSRTKSRSLPSVYVQDQPPASPRIKSVSSSLLRFIDQPPARPRVKSPSSSSVRFQNQPPKKSTMFTPVDMDVLRGLDSDFNATAAEASIGEKARRAWAFRSAMISIAFIFVYLTLGIVFFSSQTDWGLPDTILFAVYSATSAGYGHVEIPTTVGFQLFIIVYILVGIASLAIMVAQVFQYLQLEASRAEDRRQASELARNSYNSSASDDSSKPQRERCVNAARGLIGRVRLFFKETRAGSILAVFLPLTFLVSVGACTIGIIEGWTFVEMIYYGVVSLTTTGYGDYYPTKTSSILICSVWLPCNIIFTSIYMGSVVTWYLNLSSEGIQRIRNQLHDKVVVAQAFDRSISTPGNLDGTIKVHIENGLCDYLYDEDDESIGSNEPTATKSSDNGNPDDHTAIDGDGMAPMVVLENMTGTLTTMDDVIQAVMMHTKAALMGDPQQGDENGTSTESFKFMSLQPSNEAMPCFSLRVLVKQRLAAIIARDLAGGDHCLDVQDAYIIIRIGQWKEVVARWLIPSGAWKAFRATALDAMMLVGERTLIQLGPDALYRLSPDEFHSVFSPLVAAMGDAETLQGWLNSTDQMAAEYFVEKDDKLSLERLNKKKVLRKLRVDDEEMQMPKSQGTAFH